MVPTGVTEPYAFALEPCGSSLINRAVTVIIRVSKVYGMLDVCKVPVPCTMEQSQASEDSTSKMTASVTTEMRSLAGHKPPDWDKRGVYLPLSMVLDMDNYSL